MGHPPIDLTTSSPAVAMTHVRDRRELDPVTLKALDNQLHALMGDPDEPAALRLDALEGFLDFLSGEPGLRHPNLSFDALGNVVASWRPRADAKVSLTFEGRADARWLASDRTNGIRGSGRLEPFGAAGLGADVAPWLRDQAAIAGTSTPSNP